MHLSHIPHCAIQNRNVHISVLNGASWEMMQVYCGNCENGARFGFVQDTWCVSLYLCYHIESKIKWPPFYRRYIQNPFPGMRIVVSIKITLKFESGDTFNDTPTLGQIMAWRLTGDTRLSEPMMCATRPQYVIIWCDSMVCLCVLVLRLARDNDISYRLNSTAIN